MDWYDDDDFVCECKDTKTYYNIKIKTHKQNKKKTTKKQKHK